ncbi:RNA polymerase I specific transcription initiation factor [Trema orientale]|uniref:RNA polymerase I specific transcription initiation factor n=1 Tax=Trema orientale TaxID=63057 RepID=A0A2P5FWQ3_TREOI|nr:RNA polymerase I specific transcription initiation factor [Trema orientale]
MEDRVTASEGNLTPPPVETDLGSGPETMDNVDFTDADLVHHVKDALNKVSMGHTDKYNQLVAVMHLRAAPAPDAIALLVHIPVCPFHQIQIVSLYAWETSLKALSGAVIHIDNDRHELLLKLIFCMSLWNYGPDVMDALLELIVLLPRGIARKDQVLSRVHSALEDIADLMPLVPMKLLPIVIKRKPHYNSQEQVLSVYVENMVKVGGRCLWEIFKMELEDAAETADDESDCTESYFLQLPRELSQKSLGGNQFAESLDSLMELTFEHLEECEVSGRLIEILSGTRFATMLTDIFVYNVYLLLRMSAVAYLAIYLSCGKFLSTSLVIDTLKRWVDWCFEYCKMQNGEIDPKAHRIFYSGCQAIMYVLCFCMRSLMTIPRFRSQLLSLPIGIILSHSLCPLKVCLPSVVNEFLLQAKAARLFTPSEQFDFDNHMESELSIAFGGIEERLDMFFPFDPYLPKKSDRFIRPNFVYWSMVNPIYDYDEACSSDEEVAKAMMNDGMSRKFEDLDLDEFDSALNKMSITPNYSLRYRCGGSLRDLVRMPSRLRPSTSPESLWFYIPFPLLSIW